MITIKTRTLEYMWVTLWGKVYGEEAQEEEEQFYDEESTMHLIIDDHATIT